MGQRQEIGDDAAAVVRARQLCTDLGATWSSEGVTVKREGASWHVVRRSPTVSIIVRGSDGTCTSFADLGLSDEVYRRKGRQARVVDGHVQAWDAGERALRHAGQWDDGWEHGNLRDLADQPGADRAKDAHSDRYTLEWLKKAPGYEGAYGRATMTLDLVTGRPVGFTVNVLQFTPPARTMTRDEAVAAVTRPWSTEYLRLRNAGYGREAEQFYGGVNAQTIRAGLFLQVRDDGSACFGSDYGERLANEGKARLCWVFGHEGTEIAVDAENGQPFSGGVSKASADLARMNPPRNPYWSPTSGVMENPLLHGPLPLCAAATVGVALGWELRSLLRR